MRNILLTIMVVLVTLFSFPNKIYSDMLYSEESIFEKIKKKSVSILSLGGGLSLCSGVIIDMNEKKTTILTCNHCIGTSEETRIDNKLAEFSVTSAIDDLALITVKGIDKQRVGQISQEIKNFRKPDAYKLKGIRFVGERLRKKERRAVGVDDVQA